MGLVAVPQTLENLDGMAEGRLLDLDGLEPAFEGRILFEVLAVLVEGRGPDGLQLAAGQHGLEDGRRVDGSFRRAGSDEGMQLIYEKNDVAAGPDLLEHFLEALLEITPVAATGYQCDQIEGVELLALDGLWHVAGDDLL